MFCLSWIRLNLLRFLWFVYKYWKIYNIIIIIICMYGIFGQHRRCLNCWCLRTKRLYHLVWSTLCTKLTAFMFLVVNCQRWEIQFLLHTLRTAPKNPIFILYNVVVVQNLRLSSCCFEGKIALKLVKQTNRILSLPTNKNEVIYKTRVVAKSK